MASFIVTALVASALMVPPPSGLLPDREDTSQSTAAIQISYDCDRAVSKALQMTGGELLSVQPAKNGKPFCRVTVLVVNSSGRPKKIRLRIPVDF